MIKSTLRSAVFLAASLFYLGALHAQDFGKWAQTPPMGWNSWDCFGSTVNEREVRANADYMAAHLKKYGWKYIVVDIRWYVSNPHVRAYNETDPIINMDKYGRLIPAVNRFPSSAGGKGFRPLADYIHSLGLKFGIHIMRGIPRLAVERNTPILGTHFTAGDVYDTTELCTWLHDMYSVDAAKPGAQQYYNSIFKLYASWGVDFVKVDDIASPYHEAEIEMVRKAIDNCGRPIVLSLSPGPAPLQDAENVAAHANMWRIVNDFWDNWSQLEEHFSAFEEWIHYMSPGHWPDGDMLPLGKIGIRAQEGPPRMTNFTRDEQYTLMSLFLICRSPLMFGGNLPDNDQLTLNLITNKEALDVVDESTDNRLLFDDGDRIAWTANQMGTKDKYVALFYAGDRMPILERDAIWNSRLLSWRPGRQSEQVNVNIGNAKKLYLVVTPGSSSTNWDHSDWIEPELRGKKGVLKLTDLKWVSATSGWSSVKVDKSVEGNKLTVDGKEYGDGIGTHAQSIIEYDIPEGYDTFSALVGLDKECVSHHEGATVRFHVFTHSPTGSSPKDSVRISVTLAHLGLKGLCRVRDLWAKKDIGEFRNRVSLWVRDHGARLLKISPAE
ncbi:MAG: NPCBM/NEW2 domain-containing protein [Bacteroidetes bacterium]|nr:NPCBM/NEW2 domain-containing protein [Bacteroidota bacterium]